MYTRQVALANTIHGSMCQALHVQTKPCVLFITKYRYHNDVSNWHQSHSDTSPFSCPDHETGAPMLLLRPGRRGAAASPPSPCQGCGGPRRPVKPIRRSCMRARRCGLCSVPSATWVSRGTAPVRSRYSRESWVSMVSSAIWRASCARHQNMA